MTPSKRAKRQREEAMNKYKPSTIRCLIIAEAPPNDERFFYFEDVFEKDLLFIGVMGVLFPAELSGYEQHRTE